jgi:hypothetical protein
MLVLLASAFAGSIYINGVKADGITNFEFQDVDVVIDGNGDVHIDAPRYAIEVRSPGGETAPPTTPVVAPDGTVSTAPIAPPSGLAAESWWLVSEDNGSIGHTIDVSIGGTPVATITSGDPQLMMDISGYLSHGENAVTFSARSGPTPEGGVLSVYVGEGTNAAGALQLDAPKLEYSRRSTDGAEGGTTQQTLSIP